MFTVVKANQALLLSSDSNFCPARLPGDPMVQVIRLVRVVQAAQSVRVVRVGQEALAVRFVRTDQPPPSRRPGQTRPEVRRDPQGRVDQLHRGAQRGQLHPALPGAQPLLAGQRDQQALLRLVDPADRPVLARLGDLADPAPLVAPRAREDQAVLVVLQALAPVRSTKRPLRPKTLRKLG